MQNQTIEQNPKLEDCIEACNETRGQALRTLAYVTSEGFESTTPEFVRLLIDCAEICQTASNFLLRGSELHHETCKACEEVCEAVVEACEQSGIDEIDEFKEQVQSCADACREMSKAGGRGVTEGNFEKSSEKTSTRGGRESSTRSQKNETAPTRGGRTTQSGRPGAR